jgi:hypothetical protein
MSNDLINQAFEAEGELIRCRDRIEILIDSDQVKAARKLQEEYNQKRATANNLLAAAKAKAGGNLWESVAQVLTGGPVVVKWERTQGGSCGDAENCTPPVITIDPFMSNEASYSVFLHECGHAKSYCEQASRKNTKEDRELAARAKAKAWGQWADNHALDYEFEGKNGLHRRLLALLNYPILD